MLQLKRLLRPFYAPFLRRYRRERALRRDQARICEMVRQSLASGRVLKVIIGAGQTCYDGWVATDVPAFDVLNREHWALLFPPNSIDRMLAEHVFEHLTTADFAIFLAVARDYLAPGGRIRIAVPDGNHPDGAYIARVRPGGTGIGAADHKVLYTGASMTELMREQGFQYELLEYFNESGQFHKQPWNRDDGFVGRSADHDPRNRDGRLGHTSLIVDCWR